MRDSTYLLAIYEAKYSKFIYSEKARKFCEIFTLLLSYVVPVKSKVKVSQNFVAFSEYKNFNSQIYGGDFAKLSGLLRIYEPDCNRMLF